MSDPRLFKTIRAWRRAIERKLNYSWRRRDQTWDQKNFSGLQFSTVEIEIYLRSRLGRTTFIKI